MTLEEKLAYIFDPGQMAVDFVTGVVIGKAVGGIANKLPDAWFKKVLVRRVKFGILR